MNWLIKKYYKWRIKRAFLSGDPIQIARWLTKAYPPDFSEPKLYVSREVLESLEDAFNPKI